MRRRLCLWTAFLALIMLVVCPTCVRAEEQPEEAPFVENEWGFVDGAMDISGGIPADAEGVLGRILETGVLRVATEPYFPPQEFIDEGKTGQDRYVGSDMEMARRIAQRMGVELQIVPMEFSRVLTAVADGECDLAISALSYTPGRAAMVTLSRGYHFAGEDQGNGLMIRAEDAEIIRGIGDLATRDLAAQSGSLQEALMAEHVTAYREFRRLASVLMVYDALTSGTADAAIVDIETAQSYIDNTPGCGLALVPGLVFSMEPQFDGDRVAARKDEMQLIAFVNGVIEELLDTGEYEAWFDAYSAVAAQIGAEG